MAPLVVRFDMPCGKCGSLLRAGTSGLWDRSLKRMMCVQCPPTALPYSPAVDVGAAGRSARLKHQRLATKRENDLKARWGDRAGGWITKLADEPQSTRAWGIGAAGEEKLGAILDSIDGVLALHDRRVPGKRSNIDHIAFAPAGIFVIDTKHYQGQVQVRRKGSFFHPDDRLYVGGRDRTSDIDGVKAQAAVVGSVLLAADPGGAPSVTPVLCFTRADWPLFGAPKLYGGVYLESDRTIKKLLTSSPDFSRDDMVRVRDAVAKALPAR